MGRDKLYRLEGMVGLKKFRTRNFPTFCSFPLPVINDRSLSLPGICLYYLKKKKKKKGKGRRESKQDVYNLFFMFNQYKTTILNVVVV